MIRIPTLEQWNGMGCPKLTVKMGGEWAALFKVRGRIQLNVMDIQSDEKDPDALGRIKAISYGGVAATDKAVEIGLLAVEQKRKGLVIKKTGYREVTDADGWSSVVQD